MSNLLTKKRIGQAAVFFTCCGLLLAPGMHFLGGRSDPFMRALAQEEFVLEGELVYRGMQTGSVHITEIHKNSDYEIEWPMRTYQYIDGQYYLYDDRYPDAEGFAPIVDISPEEVKPTQEMFERASALSGYTFSDLKYRATERREIPDRTAENMVICDCKTYLVDDPELDELDEPKEVRIYFRDSELYAIQSKRDERFIFYVSSFAGDFPEPLQPGRL